MALKIEFGKIQGQGDEVSWYVFLGQLPEKSARVLVWGYARKLDAQIAERVLNGLGEWDGTEPEMRRQWNAIGGRDGAIRIIAEQLQW